MPKRDGISEFVVRRLPRYYRFLGDLMEQGVERISSQNLSKQMGVTASQIRQDLNCFGGFGQQGYGYNVRQLRQEIRGILSLDQPVKMIQLGAGNLGSTIATQMDFLDLGFDLIGIFEVSDHLIGTSLHGLSILPLDRLEEFCREHEPIAAVICIPFDSAKDVVERLTKAGIQGFWNFSHYDFSLDYPGIEVENVHLADSLMTLSYRVHNLPDADEQRPL